MSFSNVQVWIHCRHWDIINGFWVGMHRAMSLFFLFKRIKLWTNKVSHNKLTGMHCLFILCTAASWELCSSTVYFWYFGEPTVYTQFNGGYYPLEYSVSGRFVSIAFSKYIVLHALNFNRFLHQHQYATNVSNTTPTQNSVRRGGQRMRPRSSCLLNAIS